MKIHPMAQADGGNPNRTLTPPTSSTASGDVAKRALAIAKGETPPPAEGLDPSLSQQIERYQRQERRIKMNVNRTPGPRDYPQQGSTPEGTEPAPSVHPDAQAASLAPTPVTQAATPEPTTPPAAPEASTVQQAADPQNTPQPTPEVPTRSTSEQATTAAEDTKPLSPQLAALARQRRALQVKERELQAREKALQESASKPQGPTVDDLKARLKAEPLMVLQEAGVTYDQLTEAILNDKSGSSQEIYKLREEIQSLKKDLDKSFADRDTQTEQAALAEMRREATRLAASDEFELVRETGSIPKVIDLIHRTYKETEEVLDVAEAMRLVEEELVTETLDRAALKKVQGKLAPKPAAPATPAPAVPTATPKPQAQQATGVMRTLTNRDTSAAPLSRKERALRAFYGQK